MAASEVITTAVEPFDPFSAQLISQPYAEYHRLRAEEPIHWSPKIKAWVLTRLEDIQTVLNDVTFEALETAHLLAEVARKAGRNYDPIIGVLQATLFFKHGPDHQRDRRTLSKILNRIPLKKLEPVIEDIVASVARSVESRSSYDAVADYAEPIPQYVMAHILGLPREDVPVLNELAWDTTLIFDTVPMKTYDKINANVRLALDLISSRLKEASSGAEETPLSIIYEAAGGVGDEKLAQAAATTLFTLRVGSETTMGLIGLVVHTLLEQPRILRALRETPSLSPVVVSEVLRLESNVQRSLRVCRERRTVGGTTIEPGDRLLLLLGAGNRDPKAFQNPDELALQRRNVPDVAFGAGSHFCLGASLARLEGRIALERFLRLPPVEKTGQETWYPGRSIRRLLHLPVRAMAADQGPGERP